MLRAIILALVLFVAFGTIVPIATEYAEAGAQEQKVRKKKKKSIAKKYRRSKKGKRYKRSKRYKKSRRYKRSRRYRSSKRYRKSRRYKRSKRYRKSRRYKRSKRYRKARRSKKARRYKKSRRYKRSKRYKKSRRYRAKRKARSKRRYRRKTTRKTSRKYRKAKYRRTRKKVRTRKYSKKWLRSYRAKKSRQRAIAKRKRNMRLKRIRLAKKKRVARSSKRRTAKRTYRRPSRSSNVSQVRKSSPVYSQQTVAGDGDVRMEVVGQAVGETSMVGRNKTVGGVSTTTLRRSVIDKMITENGWVENDYTKKVGNKKVYVVVAKSADRYNRVQSRTFYFTESNGQIYRVSAKSSKEKTEQVVQKSESLIKTLPGARTQQAQNK